MPQMPRKSKRRGKNLAPGDKPEAERTDGSKVLDGPGADFFAVAVHKGDSGAT